MAVMRAMMLAAALALVAEPVWASEEEAEEETEFEAVPEEAEEEADDAMPDDGLIEEPEPGLVMMGPHPTIKVTSVFADYDELSMPFGETHDIIVAVTNTGDKTFNLTHVYGSLNSPFDFSYFVQNFTVKEYSHVLKPGEQQSLHYTISPYPNLEAMEFQLCMALFYEDSNHERFRTIFFNRTIDLHESSSEMDSKMFFAYSMYTVVLGTLGIIAYRFYDKMERKKKFKKMKAAANEPTKADNDWLDGIVNVVDAKKKSAGKKSGGASPKKKSAPKAE